VEAVLARFTGPIDQAPPAYSAILIDGQRAYDLARKGEEVEMKTRSVTIHSILPGTGRWRPKADGGGGPLDASSRQDANPLHQPAAGPPPRAGEELDSITLRAHVSKGTYIRSLARDIALALGTVGHVTMLRRIKAGPFTLESAISLDKLRHAANERGIGGLMLPLTAGLDDIPALPVSPDQALMLRQGKVLTGIAATTGLYLATQGDIPVALVRSDDQEIIVVRGFNLMSREDD